MSHPVSWFQITGKNGKKLQSFYKKLFSWPMKPAPGQGGLMLIDSSRAGGIAGGVGSSQDGRSNVTVYVTVDSVEGHLQKAEAAGGTRALEPVALPGGMGLIAGFLDPEGNFVGLWEADRDAPQATAKAKKRRSTGSAATARKTAASSRRKGPKQAARAKKSASQTKQTSRKAGSPKTKSAKRR